MNWIFGVLIGLALGAATGRLVLAFAGAILGGVIGGLAGALSSLRQRGDDTKAEVGRLREEVASLRLRLEWLERGAGTPSAKAPEPKSQIGTESTLRESTAASQPPLNEPSTEGLAKNPPYPPMLGEDGTATAMQAPPSLATAQPQQARQTPTSPSPPEDRGISPLRQWLFQGNILARAGVVLLFFGVASALKLAADMGFFPIPVRLGLAALAGAGMILFGRQRANLPEKRAFGLALQGGGFALLYLIVHFMFSRYGMIESGTAFGLFAALGIGCVLLAAAQDGPLLAVLGVAGAFASPLLASTGSGDHALLFLHFTLVNLFIVGLGWFKPWRQVVATGFLFTLVVGLTWALEDYRSTYFAETEAFLIVSFLVYSLVPVVLFRLQAPGSAGWRDGWLAWSVPVAATLAQAALVRDMVHGMAWSAAIAGLYYLFLAWVQRGDEIDDGLAGSHQALGFGLLALAVPFAFEVMATAAIWAPAGAAGIYFGLRQNRALPQLGGVALQFLAGLWLWTEIGDPTPSLPILNDFYLAALMVALSGLAGAWFFQRIGKHSAADLLLLWGLLWWFGAGLREIDLFSYKSELALGLALAAASFAALEGIGSLLHWLRPRQIGALLLPPWIALATFAMALDHGHPLSHGLGWSFALSLAVHYGMLARRERDGLDGWELLNHDFMYCLAALVLGSELAWQAVRGLPTVDIASVAAWGAVLTAFAWLPLKLRAWPFTAADYPGRTVPALILFTAVWSIFASIDSGGGYGPPYVPLLNPLDLLQAFALATVAFWHRRVVSSNTLAGLALPLGWASGFIWINAVAARTVHHWAGIPYRFNALMDSATMQATLSFVWTCTALALMVWSTRNQRRKVWFTGFGLLVLVGAKLLLVDMARAGTLAWTGSLIGVALLVIAAGYFAPTPPKEDATGEG